MSRRANPTLVGAFVVGAADPRRDRRSPCSAPGRLFRETHPFVLYFEGSVNGLDPGAPVKFKGVEVGSVKRIMVRFEQTAGDVSIPVFIELDAEKLARAGVQAEFTSDAIQSADRPGLRARLEAQSLVTGLLFVNLDYFPERRRSFVGAAGGLPEIPTLADDDRGGHPGREADRRAARRDRPRSAGDFGDETLDSLRDPRGLRRGEARRRLASTTTLASLRELSQRLDQTIGPLGESLHATAEETPRARGPARQTLRSPCSSSSSRARPSRSSSATALQDVSAAARSVRALADSLERNPGSIVRGRAVEGGRP